MPLIKHYCAHHTSTWTSPWQRALNTHSPWTFSYGEIFAETLSLPACSADWSWLKWDVISMTHSVFRLISIAAVSNGGGPPSATTQSICWVYTKLGPHSRGCLALKPEKLRGSWGSAAQNIHVDGSQMCLSSICYLSCNLDPNSFPETWPRHFRVSLIPTYF